MQLVLGNDQNNTNQIVMNNSWFEKKIKQKSI